MNGELIAKEGAEMGLLARQFWCMGHTRRLQILSLLVERGRLSGVALMRELHCSQPEVSRHLQLLMQAGVVEYERQWPIHYYSIADPIMAQLVTQALKAHGLTWNQSA